MCQQVSHPQVEYAAPALHAPAKPYGVETRVSEGSSTSAESENAPFSPSLRAPSSKLHRTNATPSTGASAPSTSDMHLVAESPLSPTLAARRQDVPAPSFLESKTTSGIWSHIPTPLADRPTQYRPMPIIDFESTANAADRSWADETEDEFPVVRAKEVVGEKKEEWRKVDRAKKGKGVRTTKTAPPVRSERGSEGEAKRRVTSRARRIAAPAPKEKSLSRGPSQSRSESPDPLDLLSPPQ
ncbi:hypothetical protein BJY59DRAFT_581454 [Rhodotorula toruloides]